MDDLVGGTFTISNLGAFGIRYFTPILNPPQVAILGVGAAAKDLAGSIFPLSLTFDHRVNDGVVAATFLLSVQEHLDATRSVGNRGERRG
jgi:pyruvate dehydrogenase E2 component (dihydrolipoamide acetyltransferase)